MHRLGENAAYCRSRTAPALRERAIAMVERDVQECRRRKHFVEVSNESGLCEKEIGELSTEERRSLHPAVRERVAEQLLGRYLAEQGRVDLFERTHAYTKRVRDLTPKDLPALIKADLLRIEEEWKQRRERAEFTEEARVDLKRLVAVGLAETTGIEKEVRR